MDPATPKVTQFATATPERVAMVVFFGSFMGVITFALSVSVFLLGDERWLILSLFGPLVAFAFLFSALGWLFSRYSAKWALPQLGTRFGATNAARLLSITLTLAFSSIWASAFVLFIPDRLDSPREFYPLLAWPLTAGVVAVPFALLLIRQMQQEVSACP